MGYIKDIQIGTGAANLIEPVLYAETKGSTSAYIASIENFELVTGVVITLKIHTTNAANATLKINSGAAKSIKYKNDYIAANALSANRFYSFLYDGNAWQLIGELDTNTTYTAGTGIAITDNTIRNAGVREIATSSDSNGALKVNTNGTETAVFVKGIENGYLNIHPENTPILIPFIHNDIAHLLERGGSATLKLNGEDKTANYDLSAIFNGGSDYLYFTVDVTRTLNTVVLEITCHRDFTYTSTIYIDFGATNWRANNIQIDVKNNNTNNYTDDWTNKANITNNANAHYACRISHTAANPKNQGKIGDGSGFNQIRFTLSGFQTQFRIAQIGVYNYSSIGVRETYMSRGEDDPVFRSITPNTTDTYYLGSNDKKWKGIYATNFYGNASTATEFSANKEIKLTGDITGSASSKGGWSVSTKANYLSNKGRLTSANIVSTDYLSKCFVFIASSTMSEGKPRTDGIITHFSWDNNLWAGQLYIPANKVGAMQWRGSNNATDGTNWGDWITLLDEVNARSLLGVTDNSSNTDVTSSDTNLITGRTLYYQLAKKGYTTNTGTVTSITLKAGDGISLNSTNAITTSGERTITNTGVLSIAGKTGTVTLADLGLSNAMHFVGTTTTEMSDNLTTASVTIDNETYAPSSGDVVLYNDSEYVWTGSKWERLGRDSSWALNDAVIHNELMTKKGDMIYASADKTPARLQIGTAGYFLKATANGPTWANTTDITKLGTITTGTWNATTIGAAYGGTGKTSLKDSANALINALETGSAALAANDYVITQYAGGGTTTTTYHRRPANKVVNDVLVKVALGTDAVTTNQWLNKKGEWSTPTASNVGAVAKTGDTMTGSLNIKPASGEGGQLNLHAATEDTTHNGIALDNLNGIFRVFGIASTDGTTKTGVGTPLEIDPYAKTIKGGYTITGNLTGNVTGIASNATADANGLNIATGYLKLSGGTMTGQLKTSFKESVAIGSRESKQKTIEDLCEEMRYSSGCMGSVVIETAYTHNGITIPTGWYTYIWVPHRSGGLNGEASGDNCNYGTLYLNSMTAVDTHNSFVVRYGYVNSTSQILITVANANFNSLPVDGQVLISTGSYGHIKSSGYTIAKSVPSNAVFTDTNNAATHTLNTAAKYYITGTTSTTTSTSGDTFDTGVYVTTTAGELSAVKHSFNVSGTEKATMQYNNDIESIVFSFV